LLTSHPALITISTRASLKKYHKYNLVLGLGEDGTEWEFQGIGTETEKMHARRELEVLRDKLEQVESWKARHAEIERELAKVWVAGGGEQPLEAPEGSDGAADGKGEAEEEGVVGQEEEREEGEGDGGDTEAEETHDEADYQEAQEEVADETETETEEGEAEQGSGVIV
jgi:ATP-binding cassette subfamily D (ALD) long-chain fatty acid import protein